MSTVSSIIWGLLLLAGVMVSGCIIVPTPLHGGKGVVSEEVAKSFVPGKTTRADVLLLVGSPDHRLEDDRFLAYDWTLTAGYWASAGGGGREGILEDYRLVCFEFTKDNRLKNYKFFTQQAAKSAYELMSEWIVEEEQNDSVL
jgi:hypothetical protein